MNNKLKKNNLNNDDLFNMEISNKINFIEICAGAGGLSSAFIHKGFNPILLNDNDKYCIDTLKYNHPNTKLFHGNMEDINLEKYKNIKLDLLMGGVPCQSFSHAGNRKGLNDKRGRLFYHFIKMVDTLQPKVFMIENVKGLVTHNKGETLKTILNEFDKLNKYKLYYKVLNSNDYNVPQKRERLFIVGVINSIKKTFTFPKEQDYKPILSDVLTNCPQSEGYEYKKDKYELMKLIPQGGCWINLPVDKQKEYLGKSFYSGGGKRGILKRLDMDKPCLTLLCSPSQKQTERCHPIETRPLQILEYSRIQTFPDNYKFGGKIQHIYKQIGNAVPVNLAKAMAGEIIKVLNITMVQKIFTDSPKSKTTNE